MVRFALVVSAVIATLVASAVALGGVATKKQQIHDSFNTQAINQNVWGWYGTNQPENVAFSQAKGALTISVAETATNDVNASLGTRCKARGDFDAMLLFNLPSWPAINGLWVSLNTAGTGGFNAYRVSWHFPNREEYGAFLPPDEGGTVPTSDTKGGLRLTRQGETWTAFYPSGLEWVPIASGPGPTYDIEFNPSVFNLSGVLPFGGQATKVEFRDFKVVADRVVCP